MSYKRDINGTVKIFCLRKSLINRIIICILKEISIQQIKRETVYRCIQISYSLRKTIFVSCLRFTLEQIKDMLDKAFSKYDCLEDLVFHSDKALS